jgi:hypothetical protein
MKQKLIVVILGILLVLSTIGTGYVASLGMFTAYPHQDFKGYELLFISAYCVAFTYFIAYHFGNSLELLCPKKA